MQLRKERVIAEQRELVEAGAGRAAGGPAGPYVLVEAAGELPRPARGALGRVGAEVPAPGNFYVNLPPLFLGHFSPIFSRFFPVFSPFPPSCPQDSGNRHQDPEKRSVTVEKRRAKTPKLTLIFLGVGT